MEASTESGVTDVDLLTEELNTLSTSNATIDKESCLMEIQSAQWQVSLEFYFSSGFFFFSPLFSSYTI